MPLRERSTNRSCSRVLLAERLDDAQRRQHLLRPPPSAELSSCFTSRAAARAAAGGTARREQTSSGATASATSGQLASRCRAVTTTIATQRDRLRSRTG